MVVVDNGQLQVVVEEIISSCGNRLLLLVLIFVENYYGVVGQDRY